MADIKSSFIDLSKAVYRTDKYDQKSKLPDKISRSSLMSNLRNLSKGLLFQIRLQADSVGLNHALKVLFSAWQRTSKYDRIIE
jgi:hypothetical protein